MKIKRFEFYRMVGNRYYAIVWISRGLFRNPEKETVHAPTPTGPWCWDDGVQCPKPIQDAAKRANK